MSCKARYLAEDIYKEVTFQKARGIEWEPSVGTCDICLVNCYSLTCTLKACNNTLNGAR